MADNYLERKMEELKCGNPTGVYRTAPRTAKKMGFHFPFPPKRIMIATDSSYAPKIARAFLNTGSKVALMISDTGVGTEMAAKEGIRFYPLDNSDRLSENFTDLLKAWRDIDILIADATVINSLLAQWSGHRERYPYLSDYLCRVIIMGDADPRVYHEMARRVNASVNTIQCSDPATDLSTLVAMLSLPSNRIIDGMIFFV